MKKLLAIALVLASTSSFADGYNNHHGHYAHGYSHHRGNTAAVVIGSAIGGALLYEAFRPQPQVIYQQPPVVYQAPQVIYQQTPSIITYSADQDDVCPADTVPVYNKVNGRLVFKGCVEQ